MASAVLRSLSKDIADWENLLVFGIHGKVVTLTADQIPPTTS
ncbi:MAG: hypothetical protein WBA77_00830 [Microcoleaceae cyanobacterium]